MRDGAHQAGEDTVVRFESLAALALPIYLPALFSHLTRAVTLTVLPLHALSLGFSYEDLGFLAAMSGVGLVVGNIPGGGITTAFGPRFTVLVSCGLFIVAAMLASLAGSHKRRDLGLGCFATCMLIKGVAESLYILGRQTVLGAAVEHTLRGRASSTLSGIQRGAFSVGPLLAGMLAQATHPCVVYALQGILALGCAILTCRFMPYVDALQDISGSPRRRKGDEAYEGSLYVVVSCCCWQCTGRFFGPNSMLLVVRKHWRLLFSVGIFAGFPSFIRRARELLFSLEGHARSMSQDQVGDFAALSYFIDFAVSFPAGGLMDTIGRTWTGALSFMLAAIAPLVMVLPGQSLAHVLTFAVVSGFANGLSGGMVLALGADHAPKECRGNFLAVFRIISRMGDVIAPAVLGWLTDLGSLKGAEMFVAVICVVGIFWARCCVKETLRRDPQADTAGEKELLSMERGRGLLSARSKQLQMGLTMGGLLNDPKEGQPLIDNR